MEGFFPIGEGFQAHGYAPVGGVTYQVHSPRLGNLGCGKVGSGSLAIGKKLFTEHTSMVEAGPHDPPKAGYHPALQALLRDVRIYSLKIANSRIY